MKITTLAVDGGTVLGVHHDDGGVTVHAQRNDLDATISLDATAVRWLRDSRRIAPDRGVAPGGAPDEK